MEKYQPSRIEKKWQKRWARKSADLLDSKKKFYMLVEFTYPSGDLHMGHWFTFAVPDILARYKRMQGFNVFSPNGFDAFGLPAENAAMKKGVHPHDWTYSNIARMKEQFATMGGIYDWAHEVITCDPEYYRWNQWIFLKMFERNLAYKGKAMSNWCPKDKTVLANENVENGKCWRCQTEVVQKEVEQWFLRITDYAERLIWPADPSVDWPKPVREAQNNWIGRSEGIEIDFKIEGSEANITVFTKFPETIFGVTYMVIAPEHKLVSKLVTGQYKAEAGKYIKASQKKSELERTSANKQKSGVFTGSYCINPVNNERVPIWIADYVISTYGTGAVMGVPGSDVRDYEFAKKFKLPILKVIGKTKNDRLPIKSIKDVLEQGYIVNSGTFDGLAAPNPAKAKFMEFIEKKGWGSRKTNYHLHDWSISRQRYWGTPIPIIYCDKCGTVPVPESDLPVVLPYDVDFAPQGKPPLASAEDWVKTRCPKCGGDARREVETMDTFVDSSWYFLRYLDPRNNKELTNKSIVAKWMPVDIYFGGSEHTLGHTLYSRFFVKFLKDIGVVDFEEYAKRRVHHGVILGPDGARMSKSKGNVVNPDEQVAEFGADAVRLYLAFLGPYDLVIPWNPSGINGVFNFLVRTWKLCEKVSQASQLSDEDLHVMNKTIKKVGEDIENIKFNTAVASMMEWLNYLSRKGHGGTISEGEYATFLKLLAPFAPHVTEELWELMGKKGSIHDESWPDFDDKLVMSSKVTLVVQVNGKVRDKLLVSAGLKQEEAEKLAIENAKVRKFLGPNKKRKIVYIQDRLINVVV